MGNRRANTSATSDGAQPAFFLLASKPSQSKFTSNHDRAVGLFFWCCAQCNATAQPPTLVTILRSPSSSSYPRPCRQNKAAQSLSRHAFPLPSDWLKGQPRVRPITTNEAPQATSNAPSLSGISSALIPGKKTSVFYLSCPGTAHIARLDTAGTGFKAKP